MQLDFAAILVIAAAVTGGIWLLDAVALAPKRARATGPGGGGSGQVAAARMPWYVDYSRSFFPVILVVLLLRSFVVEPFRIPSGSMMPTLLAGDFILVNKFAFGLRVPVLNTKIVDTGSPQRGDVAVFRYPEDPSIAYIKRIVGLPGDRVEVEAGRLTINGEPVPQTDLGEGGPGDLPGYDVRVEHIDGAEHRVLVREGRGLRSGEYRVPEGHYFAMGDNRDNSRDSRFWGPLPEENLIGRAFFIWLNSDCVMFRGHCSRIGESIE